MTSGSGRAQYRQRSVRPTSVGPCTGTLRRPPYAGQRAQPNDTADDTADRTADGSDDSQAGCAGRIRPAHHTHQLTGGRVRAGAAVQGNRSFDWSRHGFNPHINTAWSRSNLSKNIAMIECDMPVETDTAADVAGGAVIIIKIFDEIWSAFS